MSDTYRLVYKCRACKATFTRSVYLDVRYALADQFVRMADREDTQRSVHSCGLGPRAGNVQLGVGDLIGAREHIES